MANTKKLTDKSDLKLAWHFLPESAKLSYGDDRKVSVGMTVSIPDDRFPNPCHYGMHASVDVTDAMQYNRGPILCRVEVWGDVQDGGDKIVGRHRKVIWMHKFTKAEIKSFCKALGENQVNGDVHDLSYASGNDEDKAKAWIDAFAAAHGCPGVKASKKYDFTPKFQKLELTKEILKGLLSDRLVQTESELKAQVEGVYDTDEFEDLLDELGYMDGVCVVDSYTSTRQRYGGKTYQNGYVLERKTVSASKKKRK